MARIRTIKPEFFTSEDIVSLSPMARLLYIATWLEADREGRLAWKLATFKLRYFPGDVCDIHAMGQELIDKGVVQLYGVGLAFIPSFKDHQHLNPRETPSALPTPDASARVGHASRRVVDASARVGHAQGGREGKGKEGKGKEVERGPLRAPRGARLPLDWVPNAEETAWATSERPDLDPVLTAAEFRDYWTAKPGKDGLKLDWTATWRNWVRHERGHYARNGHTGADIAHMTVPGRKGPDPALAKIFADDKKAAPMPAAVRERIAAITTQKAAS